MKLSTRERDKLALRDSGRLAQNRLARGLKLNYPEVVSLLSTQVLELAREGKMSVAEIMDAGRTMLGFRQVLPGVKHLVKMVQVEATFQDGTKLVTIDSPICKEDGNLELALHGSFLPIPDLKQFEDNESASTVIPGEIIPAEASDIVINEGRPLTCLQVANKGDRPVQVGSHYHFVETNRCLSFDRKAAIGKRLNIPAGTAIRFEPGETKTVVLVPIAGRKIAKGGNNLVPEGNINEVEKTMKNIVQHGFANDLEQPAKKQKTDASPVTITRSHYAELYGPTTGDKVRLGDTDLIVEVENDFTSYGDECVFGGGKVLREGMGMAVGVGPGDEVLETVITNALIIDYTGIYKADVGIRHGKICGIGKAGNPDTMEGVTVGMTVGVNTEAIAGEHLILTAGAFDAHVHFICPDLAGEAISHGITTLLGGGTGPATGTNATTCTPAPTQVKMMLQATDAFPLNFGFTGKGNSSKVEGLKEVVQAGAVGLKLHEDWGTTPAAIDCALKVAEETDIQITIHTDTLNESSCCEDSISAFKDRTIHTYHSEGAGGGHAPDIIRVCSEPNVIPSSTNPTRPYTVNTIDEHLDMLMVCHHLHKNIKEDVSFAESRIRAETIAAEDILHDMGAISIISSDSQAMGRIGEVICRTWQTAHKMKVQRKSLEEDAGNNNDNFRVKRYIAKYTINPALAHGMSHLIGSVEVGKLADLCLWKPGFFGAKPEIVIKGGVIAYAQMGDANASVPTCEPVQMKPMFGAYGKALGPTSVAFVSKLCAESGTAKAYGLSKHIEAVKGCRSVRKTDMKLNSALPKIHVDPETYKVTADGKELTCEPLKKLPLTQKYSLF